MSACGNCGSRPEVAPMNMIIAIGFGDAVVMKNGVPVIDGDAVLDRTRGRHPVTVGSVEHQAAAEAGDWRIVISGPFSEVEYQRQGPRRWVIVRRGEGFA